MSRSNFGRMARNGGLASDRLRDDLLIPSARDRAAPGGPPILAEIVGAGGALLDREPHMFVRLNSGGNVQDILLPLANAAHGTRLLLEVLEKAGVEFERPADPPATVPMGGEVSYGPEFASAVAMAIAPPEGCDVAVAG